MQKNLEKKSDQELVKLALENQDNFRYIIDKYEKPLMRYVRRVSNFPVEDVEDVLQEVFIKVYRNLNEFDQCLKFSSWIYRITHNEVISHFRKTKTKPQSYEAELNDLILENLRSNLQLESKVENKLNREILNKLFGKIDVKYREVLILRYFEEKDYKEISDIIKKSPGTVATLLNRAKKKMLELYQEFYGQSKG